MTADNQPPSSSRLGEDAVALPSRLGGDTSLRAERSNHAPPPNPWLRLFRLPNLLTVPGDPLAGFLLASGGHIERSMLLPMLAVMGASVCLYLFGLAVNDIVDFETDRAERPDRPLPSGKITVAEARAVAITVVLLGIGLAWISGWGALCAAGLLVLMIYAYNRFKNIFDIGLCRGMSLGLGASAAGVPALPHAPIHVLIAAVGIFAYTIAFSAIAKNEMAAEKPMGIKRWMPFVVLLVMLPSVLIVPNALMVANQTEGTMVLPYVFVFLMCMAIWRAWALGGIFYRLQPVPDTVAGHIRNLLLVQACLCSAVGDKGLFPALFLFALWLLFPRLAKRFYSS